MAEKKIDEKRSVIVRPSSPADPQGTGEGGGKRLGSLNPDVMRNAAIQTLMGGPATLTRISKEQIICEAVLVAAQNLGYKLPSTLLMIQTARDLSPGLDGLGRGEAVKCLVAAGQQSHFFPASAFDTEQKEGLLSRFMNWIRGGKKGGD